MDTESRDAEKVTITELLNLRNLGVSITDINWNRIKMASSDYICIRHKRQSNGAKKSDAKSPDAKPEANHSLASRKQSLPCNLNEMNRRQPSQDAISIIDAKSADIKSYELNGVTSAAVCPIKSAAPSAKSAASAASADCSLAVSGSADHQANEAPSLLALTTADKMYVIDLASDQVIAWNRFPFKTKFWSWMNANMIAIIGDYDTVHWNIVTDEMVPVFKINPRLGGAEIFNYTVSDDLAWHAITGLLASETDFLDANFLSTNLGRQKSGANLTVEGLTQIYSANQNSSNIILAQVATFTSYTFPGNSTASNFLITLNKMAPSLMKIHLVELFDGTKNLDAESNHSIDASLSDANLGDAKNSDANSAESADSESNQDQRQSLVSKSSKVFIDRIDDFPMSVIIRRSLIFVTTKYGLFYAFHFETLSPLIVAHQVATGVILSSAFDNFCEDANENLDANSKSGGGKNVSAKNVSAKKRDPSIIAITKSGQVLQIKLNMKSIIRRLLNETLNLTDAKILIGSKLISDFNIDMNTDQVTRL